MNFAKVRFYEKTHGNFWITTSSAPYELCFISVVEARRDATGIFAGCLRMRA
jgi:hypothetical protein